MCIGVNLWFQNQSRENALLVLNVIQGPDKGMRITLPDDEPQLIGRSSEAIVLSEQTISRRHA